MLARLSAIAAAITTAALVAAPVAGARAPSSKVVAFHSLGGVSLGWSPAKVRRRLGRPSNVIRVGGRIAELDYDADDMVVGFENLAPGDPATDITGNSRRYRTSTGIRVGSTLTATRRRYRDLRCDIGICEVYRGTPGAYHTRTLTFVIFRHRVESVQVTEVFVH